MRRKEDLKRTIYKLCKGTLEIDVSMVSGSYIVGDGQLRFL